MIRRQRQPALPTDQQLGATEDLDALATEVAALHDVVAQLSQKIAAQFTTITAQAQIAQQQTDFARSEATANLERTKQTLLELIELQRPTQLPAPTKTARRAPGPVPGRHPLVTRQPAGAAAQNQRLEALEQAVAHMQHAIETCVDHHNETAAVLAALIDAVSAQRRNDPVVGLALN